MAFSLVFVLISAITEDNLLEQKRTARLQQVNDFSVNISQGLDNEDSLELYNMAVDQGREISGRVIITDGYGIVQIDSFSALNGTKLNNREVLEVLSDTKDASFGYHRIKGADGQEFWAVYYTSAVITNSKTIGSVLFSEEISGVLRQAEQIKTQFVLIFVVATVLILLISYFSTNHISRPLGELREAAVTISRGDFTMRVNPRGDNEIAELGRTFNSMVEKIENVDKQRSEFVSNASHELKTPLTSMKILVESLLYQQNVPESVYKDFLSDINDEVDRLTLLINDLLMMTRIENDKEKMEWKQTPIDVITRRAIDSLRPIAESKNVALTLNAKPDAYAMCDPMRVRQAINNLVDNAIKYTKPGGKVDVTVMGQDKEIVVSVKDTGSGIPKAEQGMIFERFYRVDKARSRETGGTGLGLYIVKRIALLHGGRITLESEPGKGSVFTLYLPISRQAD